MTKKQKIWMWVSIAMFAIPEILFFTTPLAILSLVNDFSQTNINPLIYSFISPQFFTDHPIFPLLSIIIEWLGILGLLILSTKCNRKVLAILLSIILLWLTFIIFISYVVGFSMSLF